MILGALDAGTGGRYLGPPRSLELGSAPEKILSSNPKRAGAYIFNAGGKLELSFDLASGGRGQAALPLTAFLDSGSIAVPSYALSSYKALYLRVTTALTKGAASQATAQLLVGRGPWAPASGAATGAGGTAENTTKGAVANIGANAASLPVGIYVLSPADMADLQWPHPYVGVEFSWGGALTAGAAQLFMDMPLGPAVYLGFSEQISERPGAAAHAYLLPPQSPGMFLNTDRELWAMAGPGGYADLRIWESFFTEPS